MAKEVCLKDIAEKVGISVPLVSKILNGKPCRISEEKRMEVLSCATILGYKMRKNGESASSPDCRMFGIIVPNLEREFFASLANEISKEARIHNCDTSVFLSREDSTLERSYIDYCQRMNFAGIFVDPVGLQKNNNVYGWLKTVKMPVVFIDRRTSGNEFPGVSSDNRHAAYYLTEQLINAGHENILFIIQGEVEFTSVLIDRFDGYCDAMNAHGLTPEKEIVYCDIDVSKQPLIDFDRYSAVVLCTSTKIVQILGAMKKKRNSQTRLALATFDPIQISISSVMESSLLDTLASDVIVAQQNTKLIAETAWKIMLNPDSIDSTEKRITVECSYLRE